MIRVQRPRKGQLCPCRSRARIIRGTKPYHRSTREASQTKGQVSTSPTTYDSEWNKRFLRPFPSPSSIPRECQDASDLSRSVPSNITRYQTSQSSHLLQAKTSGIHNEAQLYGQETWPQLRTTLAAGSAEELHSASSSERSGSVLFSESSGSRCPDVPFYSDYNGHEHGNQARLGVPTFDPEEMHVGLESRMPTHSDYQNRCIPNTIPDLPANCLSEEEQTYMDEDYWPRDFAPSEEVSNRLSTAAPVMPPPYPAWNIGYPEWTMCQPSIEKWPTYDGAQLMDGSMNSFQPYQSGRTGMAPAAPFVFEFGFPTPVSKSLY